MREELPFVIIARVWVAPGRRVCAYRFARIAPGSQSWPVLGAGFKPVVRYSVSRVGSTPTGFRQTLPNIGFFLTLRCSCQEHPLRKSTCPTAMISLRSCGGDIRNSTEAGDLRREEAPRAPVH